MNNYKYQNNEEFKMINFFDLQDDDLKVLNPYDYDKAIDRLKNLTLEDVKDDLKHFQKKEFEFRNYEEECIYSIDDAKIITSSINENGEIEYYLLKEISNYLISDEELKKSEDAEFLNKEYSYKKMTLEIKSKEGGKKEIFLKCKVDPKKLLENIIKNFLEKSPFQNNRTFINDLNQNDPKQIYTLTFKLDMSILNKIYENKNHGQYCFDFQSPPVFRTNIFVPNEDNKDKDKNTLHLKELNSLFPFRNFEDEISNLKYRHFILMIKKQVNNESTPIGDNDMNFDTNEELNNSLENLYKNRNGEIDKNKYIHKEIKLKNENKDMKNISDFFKYENNK